MQVQGDYARTVHNAVEPTVLVLYTVIITTLHQIHDYNGEGSEKIYEDVAKNERLNL